MIERLNAPDEIDDAFRKECANLEMWRRETTDPTCEFSPEEHYRDRQSFPLMRKKFGKYTAYMQLRRKSPGERFDGWQLIATCCDVPANHPDFDRLFVEFAHAVRDMLVDAIAEIGETIVLVVGQHGRRELIGDHRIMEHLWRHIPGQVGRLGIRIERGWMGDYPTEPPTIVVYSYETRGRTKERNWRRSWNRNTDLLINSRERAKRYRRRT